MIVTVGLVLLALPLLFLIYAYVGYPALLWLLARRRTYRVVRQDPPHWPEITVTLPVYNEAAAIAATLDHILALDYPPERRHVLVISDASDDGTDDIVQRYHDRGVQLLRLPRRGGKTAAENAAGPHLRGSLVVSLDATIRVQPTAVKALVRAFLDPEVGVASGRDYSVPSNAGETNRAESNYVSYEMWVRSLETSLGTIVGASGCFYAIRRDLFDHLFPEALSRDFASPLIAREHGYRSVSVDDAVCLVLRTRSLQSEFRRKIRTMARGLETLWYKRRLMHPLGGPLFAWELLSHKLARWLVFLFAPVGVLGLALLAIESATARMVLSTATVLAAAGGLAYLWRPGKVPRPLAMLGFVVGSFLAGFIAWIKALRGDLNPIWEPTRRN